MRPWAGLFKAGLRKPRRGGLVRNLNSDVKTSFCQQVDDGMLLKITEKIIQRNIFEQLRPVEHLFHQ